MSVREYIGSRYVPIFGRKDESSIEWDNTKPYEPLTIVLYEGNSYTSRQYVPADIDITNQIYWAQTGNYNAQVESYRNEVLAYDGRIDALEGDMNTLTGEGGTIDTIEGEISGLSNDLNDFANFVIESGYMFVDSPVNYGTATLVTCDNGVRILIDCGMDGSASSLRTFLQSKLGANKLDVFIISHFHYDHAGGDDQNLDTNHISGMDVALEFCDENTQIFIQMAPTVAISASEVSMYNLYHDYLVERCTALGFNQPAVPVNGSTLAVRDTLVNLTIYNTNPAYQSAYTGKSDNGYSNSIVSLNNFSLMCEIEYFGTVYANYADAETPAQRLNCDDLHAATLALIPHHARNYMGYKKLWDKVETDTWHYTKAGTSDDDINGALLSSYLYRYTTQVRPFKVWTNRGVQFTATLRKGQILFINGYDQNMRDLKNNGLPHNANSYLPPATVSTDNPFSWWSNLTLDDLVTVSSEFDFSCQTRINGDVAYEKCPAYYELIKMGNFSVENSLTDSNVIYIELGTYPMRCSFISNYQPLNTWEVWHGVDASDGNTNYPNTNWRFIDTPLSIASSVSGLNWSVNGTKNDSVLNRLMRMPFCIVGVHDSTTDATIYIPLFKCVYANSEWQWRGCAPMGENGFICVYIHGGTGTKTLGNCHYVDTVNNTKRNCTVVSALNPYSL